MAPPKFEIGNDFYYWETTADSNLGDAMKNMRNFKKLEDLSEHNLMNIFGRDRHFVWIRAEFEIPKEFKNQPLGLVIPHLRFAEQVYCNNVFISQYGNFPPHEISTLYKAHFFSFPLNILNQDGKNMVLIKVFSMGDSGISSHAFIWPTRYAYPAFENINFVHTRIYMLFFGIMLFTGILYMVLYANLKDFKEFRIFSTLNFVTLFFLVYFFATEIPAYNEGMIPHLIFSKFTLCIPGYLIIYLSTRFASAYCGSKTYLPIRIIRTAIISVQVALTLFATSYDFLLKISMMMMTLVMIQIALGIFELVMNILNEKTRTNALQVFLGYTPFLAGITLDIALRIHDNTIAYPYFMIFGWQAAIVIFIGLLARRFGIMYQSNLRLSNHLIEEVEIRTQDLKDANDALQLLNDQLESDKQRSDIDLEMASVVQRKFLPRPNKNFKGWEIATCYSPQSKVSGDFYDYYSYNDILNGLTLFDVSGHGLSASLVTMLSKNIISRMFQTGFRKQESVDNILNKINNMILFEKGDIENYMTGILCRFDGIDSQGRCKVEVGNAGHPYPLKYSVSKDEVYELKGNDGKQHYGAIGMRGITTSFARTDLMMAKGDLLVFYTDGLTEATNPEQEQFGIENIKRIIQENHDKSPSEIIGSIMEALDDFTDYENVDDDITVIIAKRTDEKDFVSDEEHDEDYFGQYEELEAVDDDEDDFIY